MKDKELLQYETPSIAEYISWSPLQTLIGKYTAWQINRKLYRMQKRQYREKFLEQINN